MLCMRQHLDMVKPTKAKRPAETRTSIAMPVSTADRLRELRFDMRCDVQDVPLVLVEAWESLSPEQRAAARDRAVPTAAPSRGIQRQSDASAAAKQRRQPRHRNRRAAA